MSSPLDRFTENCVQCRALIAELLQAREALERADRAAPGGSSGEALRKKVLKLQAASERRFLEAMDALSRIRSGS